MANSSTVRVGDEVMIIGAPYALAHSMSAGWISACWPPNTVYKSMPLAEFFQTTATINTARKLLLERKSFWSGLDGTMLTGELAAIFNVPAPSGFLVKTVAQRSSAWDMGLLGGDKSATIGGQEIAVGGDIILSVDGIAVGSDDNVGKFRNRLAAEPPARPSR